MGFESSEQGLKPPPPMVTVRGEAVVRAEPDEALLWLTLTSLKDAPGPALSDVAARSTMLVSLLDQLRIEPAHRSTSAVSVQEEFDHGPSGRRSLGHRALSRVAVRLSEPDVISQLITDATAKVAARIDGPYWQIAPDNPARLEAARQAAADGRRKAQAFAEGAGARLGRLLSLTEPDNPRMAIRTAAAKQPAGIDSMPIEAGEYEVAAVIQVSFALDVS